MALLQGLLLALVYAGDCGLNGCDVVTVDDLPGVVATWQAHPDCNNDGFLTVADFVCLVNTVPNLNPPNLPAIADINAVGSATINRSFAASNPNSASLSYRLRPQLANATLDAATGDFSFTPSPGQSDDLELTIWVSDGFSRDFESFRLRVRPFTTLASTSPASGEADVAVTRETILRFDNDIDIATLDDDSVFATFAGEKLNARMDLSADFRRVTLFYDSPLPASARLRVTVNGNLLQDTSGNLIDADGDGTAGGSGFFDFDTLSLTSIDGTVVCGRVFASELVNGEQGPVNQPLEGVTITVDGAESTFFTTTDAKGNFRLDPAPTGRFFVHINGATTTTPVPSGATYPFVGKAWTSRAGLETNVGDVYLPLIVADTLQPVSMVDDTTVNFPAEVLANNPDFAGVSITVPFDSLFADDGTRGGSVGIAPVDPERLPGELPQGLTFPVVITVQTDGPTNFGKAASACFPNLPRPETGYPLPPDAKSVLWSFNHDSGRFEVVGSMTVSEDGTLICTDPGVGIPAPGWHGENQIGEIRLPPEEDGCPGLGWSDAWRIAKQVAKCIANFFKIGPAIKAAIDIIDEIENIVETASDLKAKNDAGTLSAADLAQGVALLTSSKNIAVTGYEAFTDQSPLAKMSAALQCATGLTGSVIETICGEEDCRGWVTDLICDVAKPGAGIAQTIADNFDDLQMFVTDAPLTAVCASLDTVVAIATLTPEDQQLGPDPQLSAALQAVIDDGNAFIQQDADVLTNLDPALDAEAQLLDDLLPGMTRLLFSASGFQNNYYRLTSGGSVSRGRMDGFGRFRAFVAPNRPYKLEILNLENSVLATTSGIGPSVGGTVDLNPLDLIDLGLEDLPTTKGGDPNDPTVDTDSDLLPDIAEPVVGTNVIIADTDEDGVGDGTEILQGSDPLDGVLTQTGIIATASTPGNASDVVAFDTLLAVAGGSAGVSLFNVFNAMQPVVLSQINTPGEASRVAMNARYLAVADGPQGLAIISLADPTSAEVTRTTELDGDVDAVTAFGNLFIAGSRSGTLALVDPTSGLILNSVDLGSAIHDVQVCGEFVYVLANNMLFSLDFFDPVMPQLDVMALTTPATRHVRLTCGADLVYAIHGKGYNTIDISDPAQLTELASGNTTAFGWQDLAVNGSGLGVAAVGPNANSGNDLANDITLYDTSNPLMPDQPLTSYQTPGAANAVAINNGLAYVADRNASLQVLNYLGFDTLGIAPTIMLNSSTGLMAEESQMVTISADVSDDVQVRNVAFFIDGALVFNDGAFPFEYRFQVPQLADVSRFTVQARATDTGGNQQLSDPLTLDVVADGTAPQVVSNFPVDGATITTFTAANLAAFFTEPLDQAAIDGNSVLLVEAGADEAFDTGDDVVISGLAFSFQDDGNILDIEPSPLLEAGLYRATLTTGLVDLAGNPLAAPFSWQFTVEDAVVWVGESGNWFDAANWSSGAVPGFDDLVIIDVAGSIEVNVVGGVNIRSLTSRETLRLSSSTFTVREGSQLQDVIVDGGTLDLDAASTLRNLTLRSGGNFGVGALTVTNMVTFEGGDFAGASVTTPILEITGATAKTLNSVALTVTQEASWNEGDINGVLGSQLIIEQGATFNITGTNAYTLGGGGTTLLNFGTIEKTAGGETQIGATFDHFGAFTLGDGLLFTLNSGTADAGTSLGTFQLGTGSQLNFVGTGIPVYTLDEGTGFVGDGTVLLNSNWTLNVAISLDSLHMSGGRIQGPGGLNVGTFNWDEGQLNNVVVTVSDVFNLSTPNTKTMTGATILNDATASWLNGDLDMNSGSAFTNNGGGIFDLQGDLTLNWNSGAQPALTNLGTMRKSSGSGTATLEANVTQEGSLEVQSGTLDFGLDFTQVQGNTTISPGATIANTGFDVNGGTFGGSGQVTGGVFMSGQLQIGQSPGSLTIVGDLTFETNGMLDIEIEGLAAGTGYDQLNVTGSVTLSGTLNVDTSIFTTGSGQTFTLITSTGGVSGSFVTVQDDPPGGQVYQYQIQGMDFEMNVFSP